MKRTRATSLALVAAALMFAVAAPGAALAGEDLSAKPDASNQPNAVLLKALDGAKSLVVEVAVPPTCEKAGHKAYWRDPETGTLFSDPLGEFPLDSVDDVTIAPLGHIWGAWEQTVPATEAAAGTETRTCARDKTHVDTRPIPRIGHVHSLQYVTPVAPTCDKGGRIGYWVCPGTEDDPCGRLFADKDGKTEINKEDIPIPAGHDWGDPTYTWAADNSTVTAERVCKRDATHVETETVEAKAVTEAATCTKPGKTTYTATFENPAFQTQTKIVETPALGHDWGDATYGWSTDNSSCTATRVCKRDTTHVETETVTAKVVVEQATCTKAGKTTYTATFENKAFAEQTKVEEIAALGHNWDEGKVTKAPTATEAGVKTYTCQRCGETKTEVIPPTGTTIVYSCTGGNGASWRKGSSTGLEFTFKRSEDDTVTFSHLTGVQVDGKTISLSDFTARSGSAIVTLRPSYLEKLSVGNHTVSAVFDDAPSATANFTVVAANTPTVTPTSGTTATTQGTTSTTATDTAKGDALPKTGDGASLFAWSAVVAAAIIVLIGAIALRKRANSGRSKR